ncbi:MAG TPA: M28 family metallopeptidase, partial [Cyclobacteriaceae bacterium]|nr:M28 family metallopeptidase [Cyclobacteriaceae bacterium]
MIKSTCLLWIGGLSIFLCACQSGESRYDVEDGLASFTVPSLEEKIKTLSSDEFMGRKPFTEGETKTLEYLQAEYKKIGLEPGNETSYLQEVPLMEITTTADSSMTIEGSKGKFNLKGLDDYVIWTRDPEGTSLDKAELVFAGYGIVAPEYNWNDYEGLDVKDKIVIVFVNDPGFGMNDSTFFKGNTMTYYGRWTYKYEEAARRGAKGCLVIHDDIPASYGFWVVQNSWNTSKFYLDSRGKAERTCDVEGWISLPATKKLFQASGLDYAKEFSDAHKPGFKGRALSLKASTTLKASVNFNKSYNVIGKITGSERPDEVIIYSAHWDHLGIGKADEEGDSIYNGALDNASGVAGVMEIAKAFTSLKTKPKRSIVFLAVTAEEQGLLGSQYYSENPVYPKENTVADINIDGVNAKGKMNDIALVGRNQSVLEDYLREECKKVNRYAAPDPNPEAGYYFRSDHFNFAKIGIPSLYTHTGVDHVEKGKDYGMQLSEEYRSKRYHKPSDEYNPSTWDLESSVDDLKLLFQVGKRLAFEDTWPQWKVGSEFKAIRDQ